MTDKKVVSLFDVASETPDYLKGIGTVPTGNEQVTGDDLALPQLKLLQPMSPAVVEDGAPVGKFFDTVSNETFDAVYVINLRYTAEATIWMKRAAGGGMVARYDTVKEAQAAMADMTNKADVEIVETSIHDLLRLPCDWGDSDSLPLLHDWNRSADQPLMELHDHEEERTGSSICVRLGPVSGA